MYGSTAARLMGLRVGIRRGHGFLSFVSVVCCQVEVSATGPSLVQRSPVETGVCVCVCVCLCVCIAESDKGQKHFRT